MSFLTFLTARVVGGFELVYHAVGGTEILKLVAKLLKPLPQLGYVSCTCSSELICPNVL